MGGQIRGGMMVIGLFLCDYFYCNQFVFLSVFSTRLQFEDVQMKRHHYYYHHVFSLVGHHPCHPILAKIIDQIVVLPTWQWNKRWEILTWRLELTGIIIIIISSHLPALSIFVFVFFQLFGTKNEFIWKHVHYLNLFQMPLCAFNMIMWYTLHLSIS